MKPLKMFAVAPSLPEQLTPLKTLAYNLWWSWNPDAIDLFRRVDWDIWEKSNHNPIKMLGMVSQARFDKLAFDDGFLSHLRRVTEELENYLSGTTWYEKKFGKPENEKIAYFSAEFGLTDCVPLYSGGLGVLAGDHLKSASDMGIPLIGVGLLYQQGYFNQYLNADGWQGELYLKNDFYNMPVQLLRDEHGAKIVIELEFPGRKVFAQIWQISIGRIRLLLLDTNNKNNSLQDRTITSELYGGDGETRIQQEIVLGIGGLRALQKLKIEPDIFHINEGHSAFLSLERIAVAMRKLNLTFSEALELTRSGNIFTTHTPVPAGIDMFSQELVNKYFSEYFKQLNISREEFLRIGGIHYSQNKGKFSMAVLAINLAAYVNGVSKLHKRVSRDMWKHLWPNAPVNEVPISNVTNGVHPGSYISKELASLLDRYLGPAWKTKPGDLSIWARVSEIPGEELWRTHERNRERLVAFARERMRQQSKKRGALPSQLSLADDVLNPEAFTIGFSRRFATYKRATLLFRDIDRLAQILNNKDFPVQIIFAGKAHPKDDPGKQLIKEIIHHLKHERFRQHIVFIENYDIEVARYMVQGVDLWLNTPRRYMEASGTSGMKAAMNGVINCSILDGWWDEAYKPEIGYAIGSGEEYEDFAYQDGVESQLLYDLLEHEIIPKFYKRGKNNIPRQWVALMKNSMAAICPVFNSNRMTREYAELFYSPSMKNFHLRMENDQRIAREIAHWKKHLRNHWQKIHFVDIAQNEPDNYQVGRSVEITAKIFIDGISPEDIVVEIYHGIPDADHNYISEGRIQPMELTEENGENIFTYRGQVNFDVSGLYGYTLRILPHHKDLLHRHETGLILWANQK
ncbi:MAG: glycosyltransferase family 1 protein [Calditrichaeota bacterium]|nr:glycosyltransferase family 1 protein [Calditrichota bacterium]